MPGVVPLFTLLLRLSMGWIFIWSGFDKLITDWSAGRILGLDALIEKIEPVKKVPQLQYALG